MKQFKEDLIMKIQDIASKHTRESDRIQQNFERDMLNLSTELADDLIELQMKIQELKDTE